MTSTPPKHVRMSMGLDLPGGDGLILAPFLASWLRNITLEDVPLAPKLPPPRGAQRGLEPFLIPLESKQVILWRLTDSGYTDWFEKTLPIFEDNYYIFHILKDLRLDERDLELPHIYAVLARRFGQSSRHLDDWKEAFKFPFLLQFDHQGQTLRYLMAIAQNRSGLEFRFRRQCLGIEPCDPDVYQPPFESEFSRDEMNECVGFLLEYFALTFQADPDSHARNFHLIVQPNHLAYGCREGVFYLGQEQAPDRFKAHAQDPAYWQSNYPLSKPGRRGSVARGRPSRASIRPSHDRNEARMAARIQAQEYVEGLIEGRTEALRTAALDFLEARFGEVPYELREELQAMENASVLQRLPRLAALATGLDDFRQQLRKP